jgi:hypothetical protein
MRKGRRVKERNERKEDDWQSCEELILASIMLDYPLLF